MMLAFGFPENMSPGTFDLFGASHQIFHVAAVATIVLFHLINVNLWKYLARGDDINISKDASFEVALQTRDSQLVSFHNPLL